jgi:hypothetical protein
MESFQSSRSDAKYCSGRCRSAAHRKRKRDEARPLAEDFAHFTDVAPTYVRRAYYELAERSGRFQSDLESLEELHGPEAAAAATVASWHALHETGPHDRPASFHLSDEEIRRRRQVAELEEMRKELELADLAEEASREPLDG